MSSADDQPRLRDLFAVIFALVLPTLTTLVYFVWAERFSADVQQVTYAIVKAVQFGFPIAWVLFVQRRRPRLSRPMTRGLGPGLASGVVIGGTMLAAYYASLKTAPFFLAAQGEMQEKISEFDLSAPWKFIALGVFYSVLHSLLEEYYWRWFVFGQLKAFTFLGAAIVISSLGFMAHHVIVLAEYFGFASPITWIASLGIAVGGAFWAWLYHRSGSLLGPWLSHLLVDAAIFIAGYDILQTMAS